jgi:hypothetical protein
MMMGEMQQMPSPYVADQQHREGQKQGQQQQQQNQHQHHQMHMRLPMATLTSSSSTSDLLLSTDENKLNLNNNNNISSETQSAYTSIGDATSFASAEAQEAQEEGEEEEAEAKRTRRSGPGAKRFLTIETKLEIVAKVEAGHKIRQVAREYQIDRRQITDWRKNKELLVAQRYKGKKTISCGNTPKGKSSTLWIEGWRYRFAF